MIENETYDKKIIVYPNPANGYMVIHRKENVIEKYKYRIIDETGRTVNNDKSRFKEQIEIENLTRGHYTIQIETEKGVVQVEKFIKN